MTPQEFYANVGDRFGIIGGDRVNPHRGVDFPWREGTPIPSWCDGTVVRNEYNSVIGWIMTIETVGGWAGFCHMAARSPLPIGTRVSYGDTIGTVGNTGSASRGAHLHATFSTVGDHPGISPVVDPLPWITANLTSSAGGGTRPFPITNPKGNRTMTQVLITTLPTPLPADAVTTLRGYVGGSSLPLKAGQGLIALVGDAPGTPANVQLTQADKRGNEWAADHTGSLPSQYGVEQGARRYEFPEFLNLLAAYAAPVGGNVEVGSVVIDQTELIAAVKALPAEIDQYADGKKQS